jgi:hypothetical protein
MRTSARTWFVVVLLVLAGVVGAGTASLVYSFGVEYGPTTGAWVDGARWTLPLAAAPLLIAGILATVAYVLGRRTTWARGAAAALAGLSVVGALVAGGYAAVVKYDRLGKVPFCGTAVEVSLTGARAAQAEYARLPHPEPFGASWYGVDGCGATVLNVSFAEAGEHYREHLPAAGWRITRDDTSELSASRGDLIFALTERCGTVDVGITLAGAGTSPIRC